MTNSLPRTALAIAAALAVATGAVPAAAQVINVSALVTGTAERMSTLPSPSVACGSACKYVTTSVIGMSNSYDMTPGPYTAGAWPPLWAAGSTPASVAAVSESLALPALSPGQSYDAPTGGVWQRARVVYEGVWTPGAQRHTAVQTLRTGSGVAWVSYAIRVTSGVDPAPTYLEFAVPQRNSGILQTPYYILNDNYFYDGVDRMQARAAVDVYVDGLPVWSSSEHTLKPKLWSGGTFGRLQLKWGTSLAEDRVTLFLGTLTKGTRTISMLIRSDLRVADDECRSGGQYNPNDLVRCHMAIEGMSLPSVSVNNGYVNVARPDIRVYTR